MAVRVEHGDCREIMRSLASEGAQFDACVTDPPYHLTSIVKRFGATNAAPAKDRDGLYRRASAGFMGKTWDGGDIAANPETWRFVYDLLKPGAHLLAFGGTRTYHRMACAIEDAGFEIRDQMAWMYGSGFPKSHNLRGEWEGWGTALKPAWEPICIARKPLIGTVAENVLQYGTGAINVDGCRVGTSKDVPASPRRAAQGSAYGDLSKASGDTGGFDPNVGRWPANVIHDGSDEVLEAFAAFGERKAGGRVKGTEPSHTGVNVYGEYGRVPWEPHTDSGTAARFFYAAKASKKDRAGSKHPTVKPIALMRYLCRLVTPPGGTVLDPFAGSGTTLQAAQEEGFHAIGIEREAEYVADIKRRLARSTGADAPLFARAAP